MSEPEMHDSESPDELIGYAKEMVELSGGISLDRCDVDTQNAIEYLQESVAALTAAVGIILVRQSNG